MNLRTRKKEEVELNLTPLIDVVFLLLIFFMVSTTFVKESEIQLNLPQASNAEIKEEKERVEISIDAKGSYFVNGKALINSKPITIEKAMKDAAGDTEDPVILINADAEATHQSVVAALDVARKLNYLRVTIATEKRKESE